MPVCNKCMVAISRKEIALTCSFERCAKIYHEACCDKTWLISAHQIRCCSSPCVHNKSTPHNRTASESGSTPTLNQNSKRIRSPSSPTLLPVHKISKSNSCCDLDSATALTETMDESPPPWFTAAFTPFAQSFEEYKTNQTEALNNITERVTNIETQLGKLDAQETRISDQDKRIDDLRCEVSLLKQELKAELTISGVPIAVTLTPMEIVRKMLHALQAPALINTVIDAREMVKAHPHNGNAPGENPNPGKARLYRAVAVKMSSTACKETFISKRSALKTLKSNDIFGAGGEAPIFVREIWPQPVYELWRKANDARKELKYHRVFVKNLTVYIQETRDSQPIKITAEPDLMKLRPHTPME